MPGALSTMLRPRRRRFADGGDVQPADQYDYATTSQPVDQGAWDTSQDNTAQQGALAQAPASGSQAQVDRMRLAMANLQQRQQDAAITKAAGINTPAILDPSQQPGAVNLPLLAAAGAMLEPTHSGGFAEALGKAFTAAVPPAEQQRSLQEQAQLRKAQMDTNAAIWGARVGVQADRANTYADSVANRFAVQSRANVLKAQGLDEKTANDQANQELGQGKLDALVSHYSTTAAQGDRRLDQGDRRLDQGQLRIDQATQRIQSTDEYRQAVLNLRTRMGDNANTNSLIGRATTLAAANGWTMSKAMDQVLGQQPRAARATPSVGGTQPATTQPAGQPLPSSKSDLTDGGVYNTARGPARWDAKSDQFVSVGQ
jgi:hypothetical protein